MTPVPNDPWRRVCPNGHTSWRSRENGYYCNQCRDHFDHLHDVADTGRPPVENRPKWKRRQVEKTSRGEFL